MSRSVLVRWLVVALAVGALASRAEAKGGDPASEREIAIGVAGHALASVGKSCKRDADVVDCNDLTLFGGADLSVHWWIAEFFALGGRFAGSKDLDSAEGVSSDGLSWDPEDQYLWRLSVEARLDPPILPSGLWIGAEVGVALLREVREYASGGAIREDAKSRGVPLVGLGVGWDLWLGRSLMLTPEVRAQMLAFGDAPELRPGVEARDYGTSTWLDLALRLSYAF